LVIGAVLVELRAEQQPLAECEGVIKGQVDGEVGPGIVLVRGKHLDNEMVRLCAANNAVFDLLSLKSADVIGTPVG
jgi:hypothetical protein